jgi:hypothetical protein
MVTLSGFGGAVRRDQPAGRPGVLTRRRHRAATVQFHCLAACVALAQSPRPRERRPCCGLLLEGVWIPDGSNGSQRAAHGDAGQVEQPVPADVRFEAHCGLKSDVVPGPKSADRVAKVFLHH